MEHTARQIFSSKLKVNLWQWGGGRTAHTQHTCMKPQSDNTQLTALICSNYETLRHFGHIERPKASSTQSVLFVHLQMWPSMTRKNVALNKIFLKMKQKCFCQKRADMEHQRYCWKPWRPLSVSEMWICAWTQVYNMILCHLSLAFSLSSPLLVGPT